MRVQILSSSGDLLGHPLISRGCVFLLLFYLYITMSNQVYFQTLVFDIVYAPITISACQARPLFLMQKLINAAMPRLLSISLLILYLESLPKLISFFIGYVFIRLRLSDREF